MAKREFTGVFIPAHIWTSKDLLPAEKMLLGEIDALSKNYDWCDAGRDHFAEWLQCTPQNVSYYIKKLADMGFIEVEKRPGFASRLRVIQERFRIPEKPGVENGVFGGRKRGFRVVENGVFGGRKRGFPEIQEEIQEKEIQEEIQDAPLCEKQTVVTLHTPDQIEQTALTIVEEVVFTLDAEKEPKAHIPPAAGAEIETESQAQSTYDLYAALEAKKKTPPIPAAPIKEKETARPHDSQIIRDFAAMGTPEDFEKTKARMTRKPRVTKPAADRSAEIPVYLKTDELRAFFAAIQPEWLEWVEYKAREKKGKYQSAKTEAETITELAGDTNFDAERAKAAIRYSRAKTWAGIFVKDEKTKAAPAPRYSFQDTPQAHTTQELLTEMRLFYKANTGELTGTQAAAGTTYTDNRLTEAVTAFCAHRVSIGKAGESFERQNAALCKWLQEEKKRDAAKVAGPGAQTVQYSTRAAAPIRYAKQEEI